MAEANSESAIITADQIKNLRGTLTVKTGEWLSYAIIRKILGEEDPKKFWLKEVQREYDKLKADVDAKDALTTLIKEIEEKLPGERGRKESPNGADWGKIVWVNEQITIVAPAGDAAAGKAPAGDAVPYTRDVLEAKTIDQLFQLLRNEKVFQDTRKDNIAAYNKTANIPNIINVILDAYGFSIDDGQYSYTTIQNTRHLQNILTDMKTYHGAPDGIFWHGTLWALEEAHKKWLDDEIKLKAEAGAATATGTKQPWSGSAAPDKKTDSGRVDATIIPANDPDQQTNTEQALASVRKIEWLQATKDLKSLGFTVVNGTLTPPTGLQLVPETTDQYEVNEYYEVVNGSIQPRNPDDGSDYSNGVLTAIKDIPWLENTKDLKSLGFRVNSNNELVFPVGILEENDDSIKIASYAHVVQGTIQLKEGFTKNAEGKITNVTIDQLAKKTLEDIQWQKNIIETMLSTIQNTLDKNTISKSMAAMEKAMAAATASSDVLKEKEWDYSSSQRSLIDEVLGVMQSTIDGATKIQAGLDARIWTLRDIWLQINQAIGDSLITKEEFTTIKGLFDNNKDLFTKIWISNTEGFLERVGKGVDGLSFPYTKLELYRKHEFTLEDGIVHNGYNRALPKGATSTIRETISEGQP